MRQWDIQQQAFKTSRLIRHQEYGTYESNRGNISGRPSPSNSTPMSLHHLSKTSLTSIFSLHFFLTFFSHTESAAKPDEKQLSKTPNPSSSH
jgi:hypothetical protein